ncbi:MAG: hypothetical protein J6S14_01330 [Clostridia bacterium]|nr:hypothetical protein [Clostridia bacterium]
MTRDETKALLIAVQSLYPQWRVPDPKLTLDAWAVVLKEYDFNVMQAALKRYAITNSTGFAPSVGQLIGQISEAQSKQELTALEAWGMVLRAIGNSAYNSVEEYNALPETVRRSVGSPGNLRAWSQLEYEGLNVAQAQFMRVYNALQERAVKDALIPEDVRNRLNFASHAALEKKDE